MIRDGLDSRRLILTYSLVAASVPGLSDLQNELQFTIVDNPLINTFEDGVLGYQTRSNEAVLITVSFCL